MTDRAACGQFDNGMGHFQPMESPLCQPYMSAHVNSLSHHVFLLYPIPSPLPPKTGRVHFFIIWPFHVPPHIWLLPQLAAEVLTYHVKSFLGGHVAWAITATATAGSTGNLMRQSILERLPAAFCRLMK